MDELTDQAGTRIGTVSVAETSVVAETPVLPLRLTAIQWRVCGVAALGFAFDIHEIVILPLVLRPALAALGHLTPGTPAFNLWAGLLLLIPAAAGGVFGLLGGYLTDVFGRRRVL